MIDQSVAVLSTSSGDSAHMIFSDKDKKTLSLLAARVAELAARPVENEKKMLWYRHNDPEGTRPLIFCDPENGWNEIITDAQMEWIVTIHS